MFPQLRSSEEQLLPGWDLHCQHVASCPWQVLCWQDNNSQNVEMNREQGGIILGLGRHNRGVLFFLRPPKFFSLE